MIHPTDFDAVGAPAGGVPPAVETVDAGVPPPSRSHARALTIVAACACLVLGIAWLVEAGRASSADAERQIAQTQLETTRQDLTTAQGEVAALRQRLSSVAKELDTTFKVDEIVCFRPESPEPADAFDSGIAAIRFRIRGANPLAGIGDFQATLDVKVFRPGPGSTALTFDGKPGVLTLSCASSETTCSGEWGFHYASGESFESGTWTVEVERAGRSLKSRTFEVR